MNTKKDLQTWGITLVLWGGLIVFGGLSGEAFAQTDHNVGDGVVQKEESTQKERPVQKKGEDMVPDLPPPAHDPEMVIQPDVPVNPDAVVVPPPIDPEMAVNPATREPMNKEKLEELQEKGSSGEEQPGDRK